MDNLPDDLLDPAAHTVKGVVEAAFEGQSAERAIAPTARRELAVHQSTQLVLGILDEAVRGADVCEVGEQEFLGVELDSAAAHGLVPDFLIMHGAVRDKRKISTKTTK